MALFLIIGDGKIGRRLISSLGPSFEGDIFIDRSTNWRRIARLIYHRRLAPGLLAKMAWAEFRRQDYSVPDYPAIRTNQELLGVIEKYRPKRIYLFRAGLILNRAVVESGVEILNVHCNKLPEYPGIGSLEKAHRAGCTELEATMHHVTVDIDGGEVVDVEPFTISPDLPYDEVEKRAYSAGIMLLLRYLEAGNGNENNPSFTKHDKLKTIG